jgi:hypothetical protein
LYGAVVFLGSLAALGWQSNAAILRSFCEFASAWPAESFQDHGFRN